MCHCLNFSPVDEKSNRTLTASSLVLGMWENSLLLWTNQYRSPDYACHSLWTNTAWDKNILRGRWISVSPREKLAVSYEISEFLGMIRHFFLLGSFLVYKYFSEEMSSTEWLSEVVNTSHHIILLCPLPALKLSRTFPHCSVFVHLLCNLNNKLKWFKMTILECKY